MTQKNRHLRYRTTLLGYIFARRHVSTIGKKLVKWQFLPHMSSPYGELRLFSGWDPLASLRHPGKFQWVSRLAFVTAVTSLTGGQPNFARCLAVSWAATLFMLFRRLLHRAKFCQGQVPLTEFCPVQNTPFTQVLRSRILAALLPGTPAADVSQTLRRGTRNGITELSQRAPPIFGRAAITLGIGPHSSVCNVCKNGIFLIAVDCNCSPTT